MPASNAKRFLSAFNNIEYSLKTRYGFNRSMGFSELIRKTVVLNYTVRKFEDDLVDYGRLRNAIIHNNNEDYVIAEPHEEVVKNIEHIEKLLTKPPLVLDTVAQKDVLTMSSSATMKDVIITMTKSKFSNIPVYNKEQLIGIANGQKILDSFGQFILAGGKAESFLSSVKIEDMLSSLEKNDYYIVASAKMTIEDALNAFHSNAKLLAILITKNGKKKEMPLGIMTGKDVIEANSILETY